MRAGSIAAGFADSLPEVAFRLCVTGAVSQGERTISKGLTKVAKLTAYI